MKKKNGAPIKDIIIPTDISEGENKDLPKKSERITMIPPTIGAAVSCLRIFSPTIFLAI